MSAKPSRGFTLIELILAMIIAAFAILTLTMSLYPRSKQSAEQIYSIKAAELGRAVMDEVLGRNYDQNSGPNGGLPECGNTADGGADCTLPGSLGPDGGETSREEFNDVDDFDGLSGAIEDVLGTDLAAEYPNYQVSIAVFYDADNDGVSDSTAGNYKRIEVTIKDPSGQEYPFSAYRGNF
jgi:MSHA pilin protein MshD